MKTTVKIQELSDGRFRNAVTGKIGDSIGAVVGVKDAINVGALNTALKSAKFIRKDMDIAIKNLEMAVSNKDEGSYRGAYEKFIRLNGDIADVMRKVAGARKS